jgi:hypothetical protein
MTIPARRFVLLGLAFLWAVAAQAGPIVANSGFEQPNVGGGYRYGDGFGPGSPITIAEQGGAGWTFVNGAGIAANGSAFGVANASGNQAGFIQGGPGSIISQLISGFGTGFYTLGFIAEGRSNFGSGDNPLEVTIDGVPLTFGGNPIINPPVGTVFQSFTSDPFFVNSGSHTLAFNGQGVNGLDVTSFVDDVSFPSFVPVPEPGSLALFGMTTVAGAVYCGWRRRRAIAVV